MNSKQCPSIDLLKFLGKKWTLVILWEINEKRKVRFNQLLDSLDGISPKTLSERLKKFTALGIMNKKRYNEVPPRTEYILTSQGDELMDVFQCVDDWTEKHMDGPQNN